jgi:hypothetical protein
MVPASNDARVGGLTAVALQNPRAQRAGRDGMGGDARAVSARARARIERQTAVVHEASTSGRVRRWLAWQAAEAERMAIRQDLARAGLL